MKPYAIKVSENSIRLFKDYWNNAVEFTTVTLFDEDGDVPLVRSWNGEGTDTNFYAGKFVH